MYDKPETKPPVPWGLIAVILVLVSAAAYFVIHELSNDSLHEKSQVTAVTLVKPQSNPPLKPSPSARLREKLAGLEPIQKEEKNSGQTMQVEGQVLRNSGPQDRTGGAHGEGGGRESSDAPAGDTLGVDVQGGAGGDIFGLVGRKGGRSILARAGGWAGSSAGSSKAKGADKVPLMTKFAGYVTIVTAEIKVQVMKWLDAEGGIPRGKLQCIIRVSVDKDGKIIDHRITGSSGNTRMDQAVSNALSSYRFSEPPPESMPRTMDVMITCQG